ncbi:MAG: hypothetical protein ACJA06_000044 [Halocynthiibacter sp.]|jgi:hypothetical protein
MKQAVVILHGMGEQIPMQTLRSFVDAVWTKDEELIDRDRPDSDTGGPRIENPTWGKPDPRNRSFELRRITTERSDGGFQTDFYEYYWAHLMHGTTWEQVQGWVMGLLFRNPITRVPPPVRLAWCVLWIVTLGLIWVGIDSIMAEKGPDTPLGRLFQAGVALVGGWFVTNILVRRFGDVARYVKAAPMNVGRRQEIREKGVELLENLIRDTDEKGRRTYERITVVAHSLGTIVAYDILSHTFARMNTQIEITDRKRMAQPARAHLEQLVQDGLGLPGSAKTEPKQWEIDDFQEAQDAARKELLAQGGLWNVTDFVTLGSPLTHAEFLMADDLDDLRAQQGRRILPTCPPVMEFDRKTQRQHIGYRAGDLSKIGKGTSPLDPRMPHHAALFAYTRWSNLYSPHEFIVKGDIVSGPVGGQFGQSNGDVHISGIKDIPVMREGFVTHNNYWKLDDGAEAPEHIKLLRKALRLGRAK